MVRRDAPGFAPGVSVLGGAAGGLSYEGMMRDVMALEERGRRQEAGRSRTAPRAPAAAQVQAPRAEAATADQARIAGR